MNSATMILTQAVADTAILSLTEHTELLLASVGLDADMHSTNLQAELARKPKKEPVAPEPAEDETEEEEDELEDDDDDLDDFDDDEDEDDDDEEEEEDGFDRYDDDDLDEYDDEDLNIDEDEDD